MATATFDYDLPISILPFGTGIGVVGFITAFGLWWLSYARQEWFNPLWVWAAYLLIGIASGLWIHGIAEAADLHWPNVDLATSVPVLVAGLIINGLTATVRPSSSHQEFKWRLGFWSWVIILLGIGTALIARIVNGTLSVGGLIIMMIVLVMVQLILWFETNLHKKTSSLLDTFEPDQHDRFVRMVVMSGPLLGGHLLGYWLSDTISSLNTLLFLGIVIFGAVWLPIISTQLGFKAFIQLVEEEMYS
jgi:hypothetical protein